MIHDYKGPKISFDCTKCGRCCEKLIKSPLESSSSIFLSKTESKLFPTNTIEPFWGRGKDSQEVEVISFQVSVEPCPHYDSQNKECKIYEKRPLACRRFPLMPSYNPNKTQVAEGEDCQFIEELERQRGILNYYFSPKSFNAPTCWSALRMLMELTNRMQLDAQLLGMNLYKYDLKNKSWIYIQ